MKEEDAVKDLLEYIGEDTEREGLRGTPSRVVRALHEMTSGYEVDVEQVLSTVFEDPCDEMVVVTGIMFNSLCEHHMLPFSGTAVVGYIPDGRVVGLSKIPRVVEAYARRLQVQERMTTQIAEALWDHLKPQGVGVIVKAHHSCMGLRGVKQSHGQMVTSALRGAMKDEADTRAEFLALARASNGEGSHR